MSNLTEVNKTVAQAVYGQFDKLVAQQATFPNGIEACSSGGNLLVGDGANGSNITIGADNTLIGCPSGVAVTTGDNNTFVGAHSGDAVTTGDNNTAVGQGTLAANLTGSNNTAVGEDALQSSTVDNLTGVGFSALAGNTSGTANVAVGYRALESNTSGGANTALGYQALFTQAHADCDNNTAVGNWAGADATGANNKDITALGYRALWKNQGEGNVGVGSLAASTTTTGAANVAVGFRSLLANTSGASNIAIGQDALAANDTGSSHIAIGDNALVAADSTTADAPNIAIGDSALLGTTDGHGNIAIGHLTNDSNTQGDYNISIGNQAGASVGTNKSDVVAIGREACRANNGQANMGIGSFALAENLNSSFNLSIGHNSSQFLRPVPSGFNTAVGYLSMKGVDAANYSTGIRNTAFGANSMSTGQVTGDDNTCLGSQAGQVLTSGASNVMIGSAAGVAVDTAGEGVLIGLRSGARITSGGNNVAIGARALEYETTGTENVAIGTEAAVFLESAAAAGNVCIGHHAMQGASGAVLSTCTHNTVIGTRALSTNQLLAADSNDNTVIGYEAMIVASGGSGNVCIGSGSGPAMTTGDDNVIIGTGAGAVLGTGSGNVVIGHNAGFDALAPATVSGCIVLGDGAEAFDDNTFAIPSAMGQAAAVNTATNSQVLQIRVGTGVLYIPLYTALL